MIDRNTKVSLIKLTLKIMDFCEKRIIHSGIIAFKNLGIDLSMGIH